MPILVIHVDRDPGLIATSLLEMPNVNSNSTTQQSYGVCIEVRGAFLLDWDNFVTYSPDKTNFMIG